MKMKRIVKSTISGMLIVLLAGCTQSSVSKVEPDTPSAIAYVQKTYPGVGVVKIDAHTIGLTWESGAEPLFEKMKTKVKADFGVDALLTAIE